MTFWRHAFTTRPRQVSRLPDRINLLVATFAGNIFLATLR